MAKEFLRQNRIYYEEKNVSTDMEAVRELQSRNISGVPTFFIGSDIVVGLDKERILQLVDHRVVPCEECGQQMRVPNKGPIEVVCPKCAHKFTVSN